MREIDRVVVKGKTEPVSIFEILDYHSDKTFPNCMKVLNYFTEGLMEYREGKWDGAIKAFQDACKLNPEDRLSHIYIERCEHLMHNHPEGEWDGVWRLTSK